ncbi:MAG: nucleotidyltransferase domain-containing protein [Anaerolineae bacterium]|nr:nucleotidyltransferase domain-containing protein [Anaerolineae bacterium]
MRNIDSFMREKIEKRLSSVEKDENVEIILAIESGSRAWGFESTDSDYDVRFIYRHELKWYLNVLPRRDVIELPIDAIDDYSGWDVRKALFLMNKSNPVLFEWLRSPIVYKKDERRYAQLLEVSKHYFSPISAIYHYLSMAKGNDRDYLQGEMVKSKKYFYVLRPLLACMWIKERNESPPIEFEILLAQLNDERLLARINDLLIRKKAGVELGVEKSIPEIRDFIRTKIEEFDSSVSEYNPNIKPSSEMLNNLLWEIVR